jgi:hypothetical protein
MNFGRLDFGVDGYRKIGSECGCKWIVLFNGQAPAIIKIISN